MIDTISRKKLLKEIMQYDFVMTELTLFLDTHPENCEAIKMFYEMQEICNNLKKEYVRLFGPLTPSVRNNTEKWEWLKGPWPWEN